MTPQQAPVIIVHGGAYDIPADKAAAHLAGVQRAARAGHAALRAGRSALDAVEAAVRTLEADGTFTAGRGAPPTRVGTVELDAAVMTDAAPGRARGGAPKLGGVAAVTTVAHPISLARLVAERCDANLLVGAGAEEFARDMGVPEVCAKDWLTPDALEGLRAHLAAQQAADSVGKKQGGRKKRGAAGREQHNDDDEADGNSSPDDIASLAEIGRAIKNNPEDAAATTAAATPTRARGHDTVGAVALDASGRIAAGTSTGGLHYCRAGRVGDSPLAGSGLLVQSGVGGVSTTGHGESIMGTVMAKHMLDVVEMRGAPLQTAARDALTRTMEWTGNSGEGFAGLIALDYAGNWTAEFDAPSMAWACVDSDGQLKGCVGKGVNEYGSVLEE